ncbi:MAG: MarR family transcriptional regulator [Pseudomonadota bacterium]
MANTDSDVYELTRALDLVVRRINGRMFRVMPTIDTHKVGPFGGMVMLAIADLQPCSIQRLVTEMGRDNSQMTRLLRSLEDKGLIRRDMDPHDGRVNLISLSRSGQESVDVMRNVMTDAVGRIADRISAADLRAMIRILRQLSGSH